MRRLYLILITALLCLPVLRADVKITSIYGSVTVLHNGQWSAATQGLSLDLKDRVKTADGGRAVLTMDGTTRIWVARNSEMEITNTGSSSVFSLLMGKIRAKVRISMGSKFSVKTPVSIASVRGTEFVADTAGLLAVLEGKVDFSDVDMKQVVQVLQGYLSAMDQNGVAGAPHMMTPDEKQGIDNEWQDFGGMDQGTKNNEDLRNQLRNVVGNIRTGVETAREITNEIKNADFSTGRTLRDVNGNVVRVEQYLLRPDNNTFEVLNLTKRSEYNYTDRNNWGFKPVNAARLDVADIKVTMNESLPQQLDEWPSFISGKGDSLHPQSTDMSVTNQFDTLEAKGLWGVAGVDNDENGLLLTGDRIVMTQYINGWRILPNPGAGQHYPPDGSNSTTLSVWAISPVQIVDPSNPANIKSVNIYSEGYGINNNGKILDLNDFTSASDNPFVMLKQVAAESIVFVRNASDNSDFFSKEGPGNLDIVMTPDMAVSIAEKLASQVGNLTNK